MNNTSIDKMYPKYLYIFAVIYGHSSIYTYLQRSNLYLYVHLPTLM